MFIYVPLIIVGAIVLFVIFIALRPSEFQVTRTAKISAPPAAVFAQVNNFHNWDAWNPWGKIDPAMKQTYEGPASGTGAVYSWVGNRNVGEGRMTIIDSRPSDLVCIKLEFFKPFAGTNTAEFAFVPEGGQTAVTWSMTGQMGFMPKVFHLFVGMDKMIGGQFEKGLASMRSVVEAVPSR